MDGIEDMDGNIGYHSWGGVLLSLGLGSKASFGSFWPRRYELSWFYLGSAVDTLFFSFRIFYSAFSCSFSCLRTSSRDFLTWGER